MAASTAVDTVSFGIRDTLLVFARSRHDVDVTGSGVYVRLVFACNRRHRAGSERSR